MLLFEPAHRTYHHEHDSDQHDEEGDPDSEEIRRIQHNHQDRERPAGKHQ